MTRVPGLLFVVDPTMEEIAIREANRVGISIVAMCDTNADPDPIDFPVPSNDDAIRAIQLITARVADAVLEGIAVGEVEQAFDQATATRVPEPSSGGEGAPAPAPAERTGRSRQPRPAAGAEEPASAAVLPGEAASAGSQGVDEQLADRNVDTS
jgi:small subunit ribosomal protein S2